MSQLPGHHDPARLSRAGLPLTRASTAMILVHGRGATAESILELSRYIGRPDMAYLAPQASGYTWYPCSFLAPMEMNEPGLSSGLSVIGSAIETIEDGGIDKEHIVIAGFSQGACLASEFVARNPARYGGLIVFSGGLIGPPDTDRDYAGSLDGTPVFLGCSDVDPHIPLDRVHETSAVYQKMGAAVHTEIYEGMGHTIVDDELHHARNIVIALPESSR